MSRSLFLAAALAVYVSVLLDDRRGGVSLMVSFFYLFLLALPAYVQIGSSTFPWPSHYESSQINGGLAVVSLSQLAYLVGESFATAREKGVTHPPLRNTMSPPDYRRVVGWLAFLVALIAMYVGGHLLFLTRAERGAVLSSVPGFKIQMLYVGQSLSLFAALTYVYLFRFDHESRRRMGFMVMGPVVAILLLVLNYPPGLSRFQLLGSLLALLAVASSFFRRSWKVAFGLASPFFLFFVFPAIKALGSGGTVDIMSLLNRNVSEYILRVDFDGFQQIVNSIIYLGNAPYRWGMNFIGAALFWVPRAIWPGKPLDSGYLVSSALGYHYTNVSNPLPSEAYLSFGWLGVLVVFFLLGWLVTATEARARAAQASQGLFRETILYALMMGFVVIVMRGALNGVAPLFATGFVASFVVALASRHRRSKAEV